VTRPQFPVLGSQGQTIDLQLVLDHGGQAKKNHYQTVEGLARRGGLSWSELHAVLHDRPWQKIDENRAILECRGLEARYLGMTQDERQQAWASLRMIRDAIGELFGPVASIESEEAVLLRGPEMHHEAEAVIAALQRVAASRETTSQISEVELDLPQSEGDK
jgi:hypothetical protein